MVSNPSVNYMLYEYFRSRLEDWRRIASSTFSTHTVVEAFLIAAHTVVGAVGMHCTGGLRRSGRLKT